MCDVKLESQDENAEDQSLPGIIIPKDGFVVCATYGVDMKGLCSSMYSSMFLFFSISVGHILKTLEQKLFKQHDLSHEQVKLLFKHSPFQLTRGEVSSVSQKAEYSLFV